MLKKILKKFHLFNFIKVVYLSLLKIKDTLINFLFPTAIILTYHRVAKIDNDPYQLAVSPENFFEQLKYLKQNYQIISLEQLVTEIKNKTLKRKMLVITFDDGYADNFYDALPILEKLNIAATIFVSSNNLDGQSFYWDKNNFNDYNRPLTIEELKKLSNSNLISIGGHTLSHQHIPNLDKDQKAREIIEDKNKLKAICEKEITLFSFPFGEFDQESLKVVKKAGYHCSCILRDRRVSNFTDIYQLSRFLVRNWSLNEFTKNLNFKF